MSLLGHSKDIRSAGALPGSVDGAGNSGAGAPNVSNYSSAYFAKYRAALALTRLGISDTPVAFVGDSTGTGQWGFGGAFANNRQYAYPVIMAGLLSAQGIPASCEGVYCDNNVTNQGSTLPAYDPRVSFSGSATAAPGAGFPGRLLQMTAAGTITLAPGTAYDTIELYTPTNAGLGSATVNNGGATLGTINSNGTLALTKTTYSVTLGSAPINIVWAAGGTFYNSIIRPYVAANKKVVLHNLSGCTYKASDLTDTTRPWYGLGMLGLLAPKLTVLNMTINDATAQTPIATYKANMQGIIDVAKITGDVLIVVGNPANITRATVAVQQIYATAAKELAALNNCVVLDLIDRWVSYDFVQPLGYYGDTDVHPSRIGSGDIANAITRLIAQP